MKPRLLLFPFSVLYDGATSLRNWAYDKAILKAEKYHKPIISIGNLSLGGTGKSPMVAHLLRILKDDHRVAVLSRGYKRKTRGYLEVLENSTAAEVGDEPLQFKLNFPSVRVAVSESRQLGIKKLLPEADVILLDDAFQHRKVIPSFHILLTVFDDLFIHDYVLPAGNLRESSRNASRADMIVVTKCPDDVAYAKLQEIQFNLKPKPGQQVFFSGIGYEKRIHNETEAVELSYLKDKPFTLVTGIANPKPLVRHLKKQGFNFEHLAYPDHHPFTRNEIEELKAKELILTTEKDYMRLQPQLGKYALYYLPIHTKMIFDREAAFVNAIKSAVEDYRPD